MHLTHCLYIDLDTRTYCYFIQGVAIATSCFYQSIRGLKLHQMFSNLENNRGRPSRASVFVNFGKHCLTGKFIPDFSSQHLFSTAIGPLRPQVFCIQCNTYIDYLFVQFAVRKLFRFAIFVAFFSTCIQITYKRMIK